eukprot:1902235-Rhodomonas_salina.2
MSMRTVPSHRSDLTTLPGDEEFVPVTLSDIRDSPSPGTVFPYLSRRTTTIRKEIPASVSVILHPVQAGFWSKGASAADVLGSVVPGSTLMRSGLPNTA